MKKKLPDTVKKKSFQTRFVKQLLTTLALNFHRIRFNG